jgi:tRNA threonylcarbamoyladenosine biosynthesis protein TsaB
MKPSWKRLAIDTATNHIYLSLVIDDREVGWVYEQGMNNHSVTIIPHLVALLEQHALKLTDMNEVVIGVGPGSYTGVRIGVTIAKMIGYLNHIKVHSVSTLALMASSSDQEWIVPMIDARRGRAFMAYFQQSDHLLKPIHGDTLESRDEFVERLDPNVAIVEAGRPDIMKIIHSNLLSEVTDIHALVPNYLQITEAERNKCQ